MPKPLVFISHSAKDGLAKSVLEKLRTALNPDFEVLLDQDKLEPNDVWARELAIWMGLCNAAVIIFSKDALKSAWVLKEATILRWRRDSDPDFVIVPILLPGVDAKKLKKEKRFEPLSLNEIQMAVADTADAAVDKVLKRLAPMKNLGEKKTPLHKLEDTIATRLYELEDKSPNVLREAAAILGVQILWQSNNRYSQQLARALLIADFSKVSEAVLAIAEYLSEEAAIYIIERLAPFWVNAQAVARLHELVQAPNNQRAICVNGKLGPFTPKQYLSRARISLPAWISASISPQNGNEENPQLQMQSIEREIRQQVLPLLGYEDEYNQGLFSSEAEFLLTDDEATEPLFIIVPKNLDEQVLDALRKKFSRFTFFLIKEDESLDPPKLKLKLIELLEPKLDPKTEEEAFRRYSRARGEIRRLHT